MFASLLQLINKNAKKVPKIKWVEANASTKANKMNSLLLDALQFMKIASLWSLTSF